MSSTFLDKSTQSRSAAELLAKQGLFSSCVNRSYYYCIQFLLHYLYEKLHLEGGMFYATKKEHEGSQAYVARMIGDAMAKKDTREYKWFQIKIKELKLLRVRADYHSDVISPDEGYASLQQSEAIASCVSKTLK